MSQDMFDQLEDHCSEQDTPKTPNFDIFEDCVSSGSEYSENDILELNPIENFSLENIVEPNVEDSEIRDILEDKVFIRPKVVAQEEPMETTNTTSDASVKDTPSEASPQKPATFEDMVTEMIRDSRNKQGHYLPFEKLDAVKQIRKALESHNSTPCLKVPIEAWEHILEYIPDTERRGAQFSMSRTCSHFRDLGIFAPTDRIICANFSFERITRLVKDRDSMMSQIKEDLTTVLTTMPKSIKSIYFEVDSLSTLSRNMTIDFWASFMGIVDSIVSEHKRKFRKIKLLGFKQDYDRVTRLRKTHLSSYKFDSSISVKVFRVMKKSIKSIVSNLTNLSTIDFSTMSWPTLSPDITSMLTCLTSVRRLICGNICMDYPTYKSLKNIKYLQANMLILGEQTKHAAKIDDVREEPQKWMSIYASKVICAGCRICQPRTNYQGVSENPSLRIRPSIDVLNVSDTVDFPTKPECIFGILDTRNMWNISDFACPSIYPTRDHFQSIPQLQPVGRYITTELPNQEGPVVRATVYTNRKLKKHLNKNHKDTEEASKEFEKTLEKSIKDLVQNYTANKKRRVSEEESMISAETSTLEEQISSITEAFHSYKKTTGSSNKRKRKDVRDELGLLKYAPSNKCDVKTSIRMLETKYKIKYL